MNRLALLALSLVGCVTARPPLDHPSLAGDIAIEAPSGWAARDYSSDARTVLQWTAPLDTDPRGARVLVTRVDEVAFASLDELGRWLVDAQRRLPHARFGAPIPFVTKTGFTGVRVEGEFIPPNRHTAYRRLHAVIVDGTSLVHVIYTARQTDRENFDAIVDSFAREGE